MGEARFSPVEGYGSGRPHPLVELTRARLLEFLREPEAVFWVFVFPVLLALALGIAFRSKPADTLRAAVEGDTQVGTRIVAMLRTSPDLTVVELSAADGDQALRTGKVDVVIVGTRSAVGNGGEPLSVTYRY